MTNTNWTPEQTNNMLALNKKLIGLGIQAKPVGIEEGPVVTAYLLELDNSESLSRILRRSEDFALSLGVDKVITQRIRDKIAVFIPNINRKIVDFKDILHWYLNDKTVSQMKLPLPLGVDYHGDKSAIDLCDCPHILLTGSTGSGKSVFEAAIISSLCYYFNPSELNLYLVDTKQLDLPLFKGLPHVKQIADDLDKFHSMMAWIMPEIRRRNGVMQNMAVRNIHDYHTMMGSKSSMPYIVLILDEFADLGDLDTSFRKADKEKYEGIPTVRAWLKQCSQIGRAAGIHIIACTQRASVKVIDGDTKTNLPCRISLRLTTSTDSRTILDTGGAENLLGRGDMLIKRVDSEILERFHGPFVSMGDIQDLVCNYDMVSQVMKRR